MKEVLLNYLVGWYFYIIFDCKCLISSDIYNAIFTFKKLVVLVYFMSLLSQRFILGSVLFFWGWVPLMLTDPWSLRSLCLVHFSIFILFYGSCFITDGMRNLSNIFRVLIHTSVQSYLHKISPGIINRARETLNLYYIK